MGLSQTFTLFSLPHSGERELLTFSVGDVELVLLVEYGLQIQMDFRFTKWLFFFFGRPVKENSIDT